MQTDVNEKFVGAVGLGLGSQCIAGTLFESQRLSHRV